MAIAGRFGSLQRIFEHRPVEKSGRLRIPGCEGFGRRGIGKDFASFGGGRFATGSRAGRRCRRRFGISFGS